MEEFKLEVKKIMIKKMLALALLIMISISTIFVSIVDADEPTTDLQLSFGENPIIVTPGANGYLELNLYNIGTETVEYIDVAVRIFDPQVIDSRGNWDVYVGDLEGGSSTTLLYEYKIAQDANPGLYQIVFEIDSNVPGDIKQTQIIKVEDSTVLDIESVTPHLIDIGEETTLMFNITNRGGSFVRNILFTWEESNDLILPVGSDNRLSISSIPGGDSTEISIDVMVTSSAIPSVYPLTITMEFYDTTGTKQSVTSEVGIQVTGGTDFEIVPQDSTTGGTTFAVANTGANGASSVIVSIPEQDFYQTIGVSSVSLGNLDAGDYTLATFQISTIERDDLEQEGDKTDDSKSTDKEGYDYDFDKENYSQWYQSKEESDTDGLIVEISYTDLFGIRQTVEKEVTLSSSVKSSYTGKTGDWSSYDKSSGSLFDFGNGTTYIIVGIVGIIIIIILLQVFKKKKIPYFSKKSKGRDNENH